MPMKETMASRTIALGAAFACAGVLLGAFGAHSLKSTLTAEAMAIYRTGIDYHLMHALGLILIGVLRRQQPASHRLRAAAWLMAMGILIFSGSLYLLALTGVRLLGAITPLGGLCLIAAWALVAQASWAKK
jgi:uncharacterized membrane protein YgdD (TMEM256/DUF423 family)